MMELQRVLMGDRLRNEAFYKALKKVIKKGATVADIGSGTGFLSFLALQLGASECYLYEYSDLLPLSKKIAEKNKIKNCHFIHGHSAEIKDPEKVDVVISETLGNFALEEHIIENLNDAKRFLKPGGITIPKSLTQYVAPVVAPRLSEEIDTWNAGYDIDFSLAREASLNNMYVRTIKPSDLLQGAKAVQVWDQIDFSKQNKSVRKSKNEWKFDKNCTVYGLALWWETLLAPGVTFSTSPFEAATHWEQVFLPFTHSFDIKSGDTVAAEISTDSRYEIGLTVTWKASLVRGGKTVETLEMNTEKGYN